jgi:signal transduction histidine kinase
MSGDEPVDILIVDDRPDKLLALESILSPLKENLVRATSGKQALRLLLKRDFALLLLDVRMPDIDGFQTAELIRQNGRTKGLPIIFLSAYEATNEKLERVYSLGAVDYVRTPTAPQALLSKAAVFVELYRKNRTLQKLLDQMKEKTKQLESFCYTVAHDLRAPLRAMSGFADVLREEYGKVLDEGGRDCLERIQKSSSRLDRLIQDLLGYCRIDQRHLAAEEVDLELVMRTALKHLDPEIKSKGAEVSVKYPLPKVRSDKAALEDVFLHLISNALKFARTGITPKVDIYSEHKGGQLRVWVEDNGIGISPDHQQRIFGMFEKLDPSTKYPGTGVGLAIVSKAIERLGGSSGVESQPNVGSRFWIQLPRGDEINPVSKI